MTALLAQAPDARPMASGHPPVDSFAARRDVIDMIATARAKTIRVGLFGRMIFLPDPKYAGDTAHRDGIFKVLCDMVQQLHDIADALQGQYDRTDIAPGILAWVHQIAQTMPDETRDIIQMSVLSQDVQDACDQGEQALADALDAHMKLGRSGFHDTVTRFINGMWDDLDARRAQEAADAVQSSNAVSAILSRLEYIGKHVRLVSLNASVEAARAGEAGRGLAVIATEFKTLAEEIQSLATTARSEIEK